MNILVPVSWLREYLKTDVAAKTIAKEMSLCGPSVDRIEKRGEDYIFDIEVTSNRPDAFSVYGIAREAHAILTNLSQKSKLVPPPGIDLNLEPDTQEKLILDVTVKNSKLCPRFCAIVLNNIKINPSPALIKNRLEAVGIRSINNIVDLTNYVMIETGQPMHAFDFDKIKGSKMTLRASGEGEVITTLDGQKRKIPIGSIVIEDSKRLIDLAGILGGENSQISGRTKRVVLFVQAYDPLTIRKTTQALAFRTDAAARFEKGVDTEGILDVLRRATYLAKKTSGARIASELIDIYPKKQTINPIRLNINKLNNYLGIQINIQKAIKILESLGFKATANPSQIAAIPPTYRANDVLIDVDLIEEIARIYGYHNLPSTQPRGTVPKSQISDLERALGLKNALKYLGLTEVITYSIVSSDMLKISGTAEKEAVNLSNPLTEEWQFMRPTVIPSLVDVLAKNNNLDDNLKIFEIAKTYIEEKHSLPKQDLFLNLAQNSSDFYEIKGFVDAIFVILNRHASYSKLNNVNPMYELSQSAEIKVGDEVVGMLGILKNSISEHFGLENQIAAAELNLTRIYQHSSIPQSYRPVNKFPPVIEDISAVFSAYTPIADIITEIKKTSSLVKKIEVIDIFEGVKIGENKKSVTISLSYQKPTETPNQQEVAGERTRIANALEANLRAKIRR